MEILLGISILFNAVLSAVVLNFYNKSKEQTDEIDRLFANLADENRAGSTIELRKYRHHRSWFKTRFPNQDFDDLIDMLMFMYISDYSEGDTIDYPLVNSEPMSDEMYDSIHEVEAEYASGITDEILEDISETFYGGIRENASTDEMLDNIGTDQEMYEAEDNIVLDDKDYDELVKDHSFEAEDAKELVEELKPHFEKAREVLEEIIPEPTYVESSYERSAPSGSYESSSSSDSSSSSSDSGGSSD